MLFALFDIITVVTVALLTIPAWFGFFFDALGNMGSMFEP